MKKIALLLFCCLVTFSLIGCNKPTLSTGTYIFEESNQFIKPSLTIEEDNHFSLLFSGFSSYISKGNYEVKDSYLYLSTEDDNYIYVYKINKDELIFNEEKSSTELWFSDIKDGSKFNRQK
jgi:hypothetical protein